jgi:hypothetical protein
MQGKLKVKRKGHAVPSIKKGPTQVVRKKQVRDAAKKTLLTKKIKPKLEGEKFRAALQKDMESKILADVTKKATAAGTNLSIVKAD